MTRKLLMGLIVCGPPGRASLKRTLPHYPASSPAYEHACILTSQEASSLEATGLFGPNLYIHRLPNPTPGDYLSLRIEKLQWIIRLDLPPVSGRCHGFRSEIVVPEPYQSLLFDQEARDMLSERLMLHHRSWTISRSFH